MAVGKGFLDQYSVFCVFGSVVGCVVVPLITQSIESVIFSAIVISLTATHLSKRVVNADASNKIHSLSHKEGSLKKSKEATGGKKKSPKKSATLVEVQVRSTSFRHRKEQKIKQIEEARKLDEQRKQEEKRERKAKKKEEKLKQREEEKKLHEEEQRKKVKDEKMESSTSPIPERRKSKSKIHTSAPQKGGWITPTSIKVPSTRKPCSMSVVTNDSIVTPLNVLMPGDALYREKSQQISTDSLEAKPPSPPPSVWKVPKYTPPQWKPDKLVDSKKESKKQERLNNDVILEQRKRPTPLNQLRNHVVPTPVKLKNQYMNQDVSKSKTMAKDPNPNLLINDVSSKFVEKPDNRRQQSSTFSTISGLQSLFNPTTATSGMDTPQQKTYSLFGPEEPNRVLFQPIFQRNLHAQ